MKNLYKIFFITILFLAASIQMKAQETAAQEVKTAELAQEHTEELDVKKLILEHVGDSYEWHITTLFHHEITIPLPIILYSKDKGFNVFMSSKLHHGETEYNGFKIAHEGKNEGKIVEVDASGNEQKPMFDISITKNVLALLINSFLLVWLILFVANSYKKEPLKSKKGIAGFMEIFIMNIYEDVIKPGIGKDYKKYAPYLLTVFFFIFINNVMGLIPIFPGGANITGNIAITFILAVITFVIVNISGTKEYFKEIFWPDVPTWLKVPAPIMPAIEIVGVFTKPFALMIRLFANILAGHSIALSLTALVFVTVSMGAAMNYTMTGVSVLLSVFIGLVEILVAYIQAYVFTMLSAVFIGLARIEPHVHEEKTN